MYPASLQQACPERWLAYTRQVHFGASQGCSWGWVPPWCLGEPPWLKKHQRMTDVFGRLWQVYHERRKFRSQTSDNMNTWKTETGRVREEKRREEEKISKKRKAQKKEDPSVRKGKVAKHYVFPMICGSGGSKSRLAKEGGWSHVATWWMNNCMPLWREAHLHVKKLKTSHVLSTFGRWDVEKKAVVARSTSASKKTKDISRSDHFRKLRCRLLEAEMSKKCTPLWRKANFEVKSAENWGVRSTFGRSDVVLRGKREGLCTLSKVSKMWGFCAISRNDVRRGTFEEGLQRAGAVQKTCSSELLGGPGADFLRRVAFWSIRSSGLLRWFCGTGAALCMARHHFFVAGAVV